MNLRKGCMIVVLISTVLFIGAMLWFKWLERAIMG